MMDDLVVCPADRLCLDPIRLLLLHLWPTVRPAVLCCCRSGVKVNILSMCWCLNGGQYAHTGTHRHLHTTTAYSELAVGLFRNNAPGLGEEGGRELGERVSGKLLVGWALGVCRDLLLCLSTRFGCNKLGSARL